MYERELETLVPRSFEMYAFIVEHIEQLSHIEPIPELNIITLVFKKS